MLTFQIASTGSPSDPALQDAIHTINKLNESQNYFVNPTAKDMAALKTAVEVIENRLSKAGSDPRQDKVTAELIMKANVPGGDIYQKLNFMKETLKTNFNTKSDFNLASAAILDSLNKKSASAQNEAKPVSRQV